MPDPDIPSAARRVAVSPAMLAAAWCAFRGERPGMLLGHGAGV